MKATGIVRRIDDLGRIVIPKEIRRTLRIRESEPMEIFTGGMGEVIFKKYSPVGEMAGLAADCAEVISRTGGLRVLVTDRDRVVAAAGVARRDWLEGRISPPLEKLMESRRLTIPAPGTMSPSENFAASRSTVRVAVPVVSSGDVAGCVVLLSGERPQDEPAPEETECKLACAAAALLGRQMEQ